MAWTGGCLCGAIRYEVREDPIYIGHCHCNRCRRSSGAAFLTAALFPEGSIEWTTQTPKLYSSSAHVDRGFCPKCGSSLTFQSPGRLLLLIGSLDRPEDIDMSEPRRFEANHVFFSEKLPWIHIKDDLPRFDRFAS